MCPVSSAPQANLLEPLNDSEQRVLEHLALGLSDKEIANALAFAPITVRGYNQLIYDKLGLEKPYRTRRWAVYCAQRLGLIAGDGDIPLNVGDNPYRGLDPFEANDAHVFFGREEFTQQLVATLETINEVPRFLALVGPSGSGKSSIVRAGLIPALQEKGLAADDQWVIADMYPRGSPFRELESSLRQVAVDPQPEMPDLLSHDAYGLARIAPVILPENHTLLLFVDQFEELFTLVEDKAVSRSFMDLIYAAVTDPRSAVRVIITLRADFLDRPLMYPDFSWLVQERITLVTPLNASQIERAIRLPAEQAHVTIEPSVVAQIVAETTSQPGALPLMQFALTELYDQREGRTLTLSTFKSIGGTLGALVAHAESVYDSLNTTQQEVARQVLLKLVTLGEGTEDVRRRVLQREIETVDSNREDLEYVIQLLTANRLLTLSIDREKHVPTVEVAHEALIREWPRLRSWLDESRNDVRTERMLASAARDWDTANRDASYLLQGARLAQFEGWSRATDLALTQEESVFLKTSIAEENRRQARWRQIRIAAVVAMSIIMILLAVLALWATNERSRAEGEQKRAEAAEQDALLQASIGLASLAEQELDGTNPERSVLLALEALQHYPYTAQAHQALVNSVNQYRSMRVLDAGESIANQISLASFSPDGTRVAAGAIPAPKSVIIWDIATGIELLSVEKHSNFCPDEVYRIASIAWSPSGTQIVTSARTIPGNDCGVVVWDSSSGDTLLALSGYDSNIRSVAWSGDEETILTGHENGDIILWNAQTGDTRSTLLGHSNAVNDIARSQDNRRIASASDDGSILVWNTESGIQQLSLTGHAGPVLSVEWSPDSTRLLSGGSDGLPRIWDTTTGETLFVLRGHRDRVDAVDWSPDGSLLASHGQDATVNIWDAENGKLLFQLPNSTASYAEFSADGDFVLAGNQTDLRRTYLWDASVHRLILRGHEGWQEYGAWSPDGKLISTSSGLDRTVRIWDAKSGEALNILEHYTDNRSGDWSPDSTRFVVPVSAEHTYIVWDVLRGDAVLEVTVPDRVVPFTAEWSPDGTAFAGVNFAPQGGPAPVFIWNAQNGELIASLQTDNDCMHWRPDWSPDGTRIVTGCTIGHRLGTNTPAHIWDAATGEAIAKLESENGWSIVTEWSPDGKRILVTYEQGVARIWDADQEEAILTYAGHLDMVTSANWSPDGTHVASGDLTGLVKIWNSETTQEIASFSIPGEVTSINWSPDGHHIIVTGIGLTEPIIEHVWQSSEELISHAYDCCVSRELTPEERQQFRLPAR